jgi:hypothetical protein
MSWVMILRIFTALAAFAVHMPLYAQPNCVEETQCRSQLLRVEVSNNILQNNAGALLPALQNFAQSSTLATLIERSYELKPIPFPQSAESCQREKRNNNPLFASINCSDSGLCGKPDLNAEVRALICFRLPCPMFEGTLKVGACQEELSIYPNEIAFPTPIRIDRIRMTPTKVEFNNGRANLCFRMNELNLNMSVNLGLDTRNTRLTDRGFTLSNISPTLDGPRDICISAKVNVGSPNPVSELVIEPQGNSPFISDEMIRTASRSLGLSGLSGYPADQLNRIKGELVPVIVQPLRDTVETAVKTSLANVFTTELNRLAGSASGSSSHLVSSTNLASELGLANLQVRNQLAITECAALKAAHREIPPAHPCVGLPFFSQTITPENFDSPLINEMMSLSRVFGELPITSESIKQRLIALKEVARAEVDEYDNPLDPPDFRRRVQADRKNRIEADIKGYIDPLIDRISRNQLESQVFSFIEIQNQLQNGASRNVGVSVPEICSDTRPSPHARREIPNCPVQAYIDLNEMNQVFDRLWKAGRLCQMGRGPYVPTLENNQQKYSAEGRPVGSGCYFEVGGMGCYLNNAPQIHYDARSRKYKTSINLKACYRGPAFFGLGKIGGDFNIDFNFNPKACNGGDFCMDNPQVDWKVVPGTERFALRPTSMLNSMATEGIQSAINKSLSDTIRIPMASGVGPLANVPLEAEGRVDTGLGFFGACLKLRSNGVTDQ